MKLPEKVKIFIVERLAVYDGPTQVAKAVKEEFGLEISKQHVHTFDPSKASNDDRISAKLRAIYKATRARFLDDVGDIPIANKAVRLRALDRMAAKLEESKNYVLTAQLLEQAAKEVGGSFTNRTEHTGRDGDPIAHELTLRFVRPEAKPGAAT